MSDSDDTYSIALTQVALPVTIRGAEQHDINAIVAMGGRFIALTRYRDLIVDNPAKRAETILRMLESPNSVIFVAERQDLDLIGFIAMFTYNHPMSDQLFAAEAAWWVEPDARGRVGLLLLTTGEAWAKGKGASIIQMVSPMPEDGTKTDLDRLYERRGYRAIERQYHKGLS